MEQLSSIDASFIQAETPSLPMHVTSVSIYNARTAPQGTVRFKDIMRRYEDAIYEVPLLRRRLVEVPGNLDFPYWIEDPDFDIEFHVRHIALPQPGDWRQFCIQVARLHSRVIDLQRPLWEVYVIEGLNGLEGIPKGSFAVLQKLHHAAMDGASVRKMFMAMHTSAPEAPRPKSHSAQPLLREDPPGKVPLLLKSYQRSLGRPGKFTKAVAKTLRGMRRVSKARKAGEIGDSVEPPDSIFNGEVTPHRVVTAATFPFDEFKQLRYAVPGATINDLAVSIMGGALKRYMEGRNAGLSEPLVAQIPVNIRSDAQLEEDGNQITTINASCGSNIADPLERLQAVFESTTTAKKRLEVMGESMYAEMADALGPQVTKAIFSMMENAPKLQAFSNLLPTGPNFAFSNMPGPPTPVYLCGAELQWGMGLGPLMPNMGLFVTATSALGRFVYGINACRDMVPDPAVLWQCISDSYAESRAALQDIAEANLAGKSATMKAGKKKPGAAGKRKPNAKTKTKTKAKTKTKSKTKARAKAKTKPQARQTAKPKTQRKST